MVKIRLKKLPQSRILGRYGHFSFSHIARYAPCGEAPISSQGCDPQSQNFYETDSKVRMKRNLEVMDFFCNFAKNRHDSWNIIIVK